MVALEEEAHSLPVMLELLKSREESEKIKIYLKISSHLKDPDSQEFSQVVDGLKNVHHDLVMTLTEDIQSTDSQLSQAALHTLGFLSHYDNVVDNFSEEESHRVLDALCNVIHSTSDKTVCTRSLWCISKQSLNKNSLIPKLESIVKAIEHGQCGKNFQSMTVEHEALNAITRLLQQYPTEMKPFVGTWGRLVYPLLLHGSMKVREKAMVAMEAGIQTMTQEQEVVASTLIHDLKAMLVTEMTKLMTAKQEVHVLQVWCFYIKLLGKALHHGSLINLLLPIVEQGFKHPQPPVKCEAYSAWKTLIENFALNPDIIGDHKRVKLIMQVFRINNAKAESVALEKLSAWWFFVLKLGEKLSLYFEQVCIPLLNFCVGLPTTVKPGIRTPNFQRLGSSPATPHMSLGGTASSKSACTFTPVLKQGCEVLAHMLGKGLSGPDNPSPKFTIIPPEHDVIPGAQFFTKHANTFISAVQQCIVSVGNDVQDDLLLHIWYSLVAHVRNVLELAQKKDCVDIFSSFMTCFREIVMSQSLKPSKLLKMFQAVLCLPAKTLSSSAYSIGTSSVVMGGTPTEYLLEVLFHHRITETSLSEERFFSIFEKLVACGFQNTSSGLTFCQGVISLLEKSVADVDDTELLWRLWSIVAHPLDVHIVKNNEVNQGNILENDFSSCLSTLCFPIKFLFSSQMSQATLKTMMKSWCDLHRSFSRVAAMVTNAMANSACEELCHKVMRECVDDARLKDGLWVELVVQCCHTVCECVDFSSATSSSGFFNLHKTSPAPLSRTKQHALGNLHSLVKLVCQLTHHACNNAKQALSSGTNHQSTLVTLTQIFSCLVTHVASSQLVFALMEHAAVAMAMLLSGAGNTGGSKVFTSLVMQKLEKMWADVSTAVQSRYTGLYDTDMLNNMAPLLNVTLLHPRRQIKNQAMILWNSTFAKGPPLTYPDNLKPVLAKVKEKTASVVLPGWDATERVVIEETPYTEMTQGESQGAAPIAIVGLSPRKPVGSFLLKTASPKVSESPLKREKSPSAPVNKSAGVKRKLNVEDLDTQDFVVIASPPKKKHILTEHQKDVMKEKRDLPALYSAVDNTVDGSMVNPFTQDSQSQFGSSPTPTPEIVVPPFSFFGKKNNQEVSSKDLLFTENQRSAEGQKLDKKYEEKKMTSSIDVINSSAEKTVSDADKPKRQSRRRSVRFTETAEIEDSPASEAESSVSMLTVKKKSDEKSAPKLSVVKDVSTIQDNVILIDSNGKMDEEPGDDIIELNKENTPKPEMVNNLPHELDSIADVVPETENLSQMPESKSPGKKQLKISDLLPVGEKHSASKPLEDDSVSEVVVKRQRGRPRKDGNNKSSDSDSSQSRTKSQSPKKSRLQGSRSPRRMSRQRSLANDQSIRNQSPLKKLSGTDAAAGSIDKWLSSPKSEGNANKSQLSNQNSLFSSFTNDSSMKVNPSTVVQPPVIMAEDTQQFSPPQTSDKITCNESVKETPVKGDTSPLKAHRLDANKALFGKTGEAPRSKDADSGEEPSEIPDTAIPDSEPVQDAEFEDNISVSPLGSCKPVVLLRKLTKSEISQCSHLNKTEQFESEEKESSSALDLVTDPSPPSSDLHTCGHSEKEAETICSSPHRCSLTEHAPDIEPMDFDSANIDPVNDTIASGRSADKHSDSSTCFSASPASLSEKTDGMKLLCSEADENGTNLSENGLLQIGIKGTLQDDGAVLGESVPEVNTVEGDCKLNSAGEETSALARTSERGSGGETGVVTADIDVNISTSRADDSSEAMDIPLSVLLAKTPTPEDSMSNSSLVTDDPKHDGKASLDSSDEDDVPLSQISKKSPEIEKKETQIDFSALSTSTPDNTQKRRDVKKSTPRRRLSLKFKQTDSREISNLAINMVSPKVKRLRGKSPGVQRLGHRLLNKSLDSSKKTLRKRSRKKIIISQDDMDIETKPENVENEKTGNSEQICDAVPLDATCEKTDQVTDSVLQDEGIAVLDAGRTDGSPSKLETPAENKMDGKELSESISTPSTSAKPRVVSIDTTPSSHRFSNMSRASMILNRARLMIGKPCSTPQTQRILSAFPNRGSFSDGKLIPPRGILKSPCSSNPASPKKLGLPVASHKMSPPSSFRPIKVPCIYSPSASPSAGILRKRRTIKLNQRDIPSPSNKRRVSFSEQVETREIPNKSKTTRPRHLTPALMTSQDGCEEKESSAKADSAASSSDVKCMTEKSPVLLSEDSMPTESMTAHSLASTDESQLNCKGMVYPALQCCHAPVDKILHKLTSSVWMRGLEQVFKAKNINTIGELSALSEYDIHHLPIRSPKVPTVLKALSEFSKQQGLNEETPASDDALNASLESEECHTDEQDLLEEIRRLEEETSSNMESQTAEGHDKVKATDQGHLREATDLIAEADSVFSKIVPETLTNLPTHKLLHLHQRLHEAMGNVMDAVKAKCVASKNSSQTDP